MNLLEQYAKTKPAILIVCLSLGLAGCGSSKSSQSSTDGSLSGNWEITLSPAGNPQALTYSGFLLQSGSQVNGSFILGGNCTGIGPVTGNLNGQNLALNVDELGQNLTLTGVFNSSANNSSFTGGPFSTLNGGCSSAMTGTWSGVRVPTMNGSFNGTLVSSEGNGNVALAGTLSQGENIGASNASIFGTVSTTGVPPFCSYLSSASINGTISGTNVVLSFFAPNGSQLNLAPITATITPDGRSLTATQYSFQAISKSCTGDIGSLQLSFP